MRRPFGYHAARGAAAHRAGRSFEDELEATHVAYAGQGLAAIARAHPPVGGPPSALFYRGKGSVDFLGTLAARPHGIPVAFDAKSEAGAASYKHSERDMHEIDFLLAWRSAGGLAFLLVLDRSIGTLYLVDDLATLRAGGSVALRTHARGRAHPESIVPALHRTESELLLDHALSRPIWPWLAIARMQYPRLAAATPTGTGNSSVNSSVRPA